ncbi:MAG TPA: GAF domain-containing protein [Pyrinomonadaceae bacterium]|jgi:signal transduction protein with GAF and PtsI domain
MEDNGKTRLRRQIETLDAANALTAPLLRSIEHLLELSAAAMDSDEASIIVRDEETEDLRFLAAIGEVADKLRGLRIPSGKGIAGFVFSSGQPIAVADVGQDTNFYAEVDRQTGYSTQTILATPLRFNGEVIGVLEYVNRIGEPPFAPFTPDEMDTAAFYAEAISSLVDAHESAALVENLCNRLEKEGDMRDWLNNLRTAPEHREMIELALLVREIASRGETERRFCREILETFARYTESSESSESFLSF